MGDSGNPVRRPGLQLSSRVVKRAFDIVIGTMLLLLFAPVIALLMGGVVLTCGRPALFRQARVTRSGRLMKITKLRTVASADAGGRWTVSPRTVRHWAAGCGQRIWTSFPSWSL